MDDKEINQLLQEIQEWEASRDFDAEIDSAREQYLKKDALGLDNYIAILRDTAARYMYNDYARAIEYYEEALTAVRESKEESAFWFWNNAVVCTYPTLISLYCLQKNYDSAVEIFNEYLTYLDDIYNGQMSELECLGTDFVAGSLTGIIKLLCEYFEKNLEVFLTLIRKCERFINFGDDESTTVDYYMLYANICEMCKSTDSEDYKRVIAEANQAKKRMQINSTKYE